jgi:hypothetical protein
MTHLFYLIALWFIIYEWLWIVSPLEKTKDKEKYYKLSQENKGKKWHDFSEDYKSELKSKIWMFIPFIWIFIGLFSSQWILFLLFLAFNIIIVSPISKITQFSIFYTALHWVNSLIGFCFGIFLIINHYHLKIDLTKLFISYLNF